MQDVYQVVVLQINKLIFFNQFGKLLFYDGTGNNFPVLCPCTSCRGAYINRMHSATVAIIVQFMVLKMSLV